ncbi:MAG: hypothetical protein V8R51_05550 [Clostridia bacterium]
MVEYVHIQNNVKEHVPNKSNSVSIGEIEAFVGDISIKENYSFATVNKGT